MKKWHKFSLCGSDDENTLLVKVLSALPDGKITKEVAIYTTTDLFGICIDAEMKAKNEIVLLPSHLLMPAHDHFNPEYRFLTFTLFHELAHAMGVKDEQQADHEAIAWYNEYLDKKPCVPSFSPEEKDATSEVIKARDWIYIGSKDDNNGYLSFRVTKKVADKFYTSCDSKGKGVSAMLRELIELYNGGSG